MQALSTYAIQSSSWTGFQKLVHVLKSSLRKKNDTIECVSMRQLKEYVNLIGRRPFKISFLIHGSESYYKYIYANFVEMMPTQNIYNNVFIYFNFLDNSSMFMIFFELRLEPSIRTHMSDLKAKYQQDICMAIHTGIG